MKRDNLIGEKFGKLTVIEQVPNEYKNKKRRWKCICECGREHFANTSNLTSGRSRQCSYCAHKESGNKRRKDLTGMKSGKLTVQEMLYNYKGNKTYCKCICDCGKNVVVLADSLMRRSPSCGCERRASTIKSCGKDIDGMKFGRLLVLSTNWDQQPPTVDCKCDCGNLITLPKKDVQSKHTQSCGCLQKDRARESNTKDWTGYVTEYGIKLCKPFVQNNRGVWKWECQCGLCGKHFIEIPAKVVNNHIKSCGCLNMSNPELVIKQVLDNNKIHFKKEYTFPDCKSTNSLRFDFAILNKEDSVEYIIEYDGKQHYEPIDYFDGVEGYKRLVQNDEIKNEYCKSNNIPLYRLPYYLSETELKNNVINIIKRRDCGTFMVT